MVFGQTAEAYQNAAFRKGRIVLICFPSEKDKLDEDIRVQKHNDPAGMLKDGDFILDLYMVPVRFCVGFPSSIWLVSSAKVVRCLIPRGKQPNGTPLSLLISLLKPDVSDANKAIQ